jgi:hypothetical protein
MESPPSGGAEGWMRHKDLTSTIEVLEVRAREGSPRKGESNVQPPPPSTREDRLVIKCTRPGLTLHAFAVLR